jgi:FkbM family methyltransferase
MAMTRAKLAATSWVRSAARVFGRTRIGGVLVEQIADVSMSRTRTISHRGTTLVFTAPNGLSRFRADSFSTKEPETLDWIDSIPPESVVWDIGANVGLYTCYAAKARQCRVIAFEPSVFNLELLARNIFLNGLTDKVTMVSLPLCARVAESTLNMTSTLWGGALSTFGEPYGFDGQTMDKRFEFRTIGLSMDEATDRLGLPFPDYIKMDVDGIEHLILRGGREVLNRTKGVSVEINDAFETQAEESRLLLTAARLRLVSKKHSEMIEANSAFNRTFNQVWAR